jgi:hypothetical protein
MTQNTIVSARLRFPEQDFQENQGIVHRKHVEGLPQQQDDMTLMVVPV